MSATIEVSAPEPIANSQESKRKEPSNQVKSLAFKMVKISDLTPASYNPPNRILDKNLKTLIDSIEVNSLFFPILVTRHGLNIVDGHRRVAACSRLGWTHIPARLIDEDQESAYATVNDTGRRLRSNDALYVFLKEPRALSDRMKGEMVKAEKIIGRTLLHRICKQGLAIDVYRRAIQLMRYCGYETKDRITSCVEWLLNTGMNFKARAFVEHGVPPKVILKAIKDNKPLKMTFEERA